MTIPDDAFTLAGAITEKLRHLYDDDSRVQVISESDRAGRPLILVQVSGDDAARYSIRIFTEEPEAA